MGPPSTASASAAPREEPQPPPAAALAPAGSATGTAAGGSSDSLGGEPEEDKVGVEDLAKTIYHQIGIKAESELMSPGDRPIEIVDGGEVLDAILAKKA
jgi:hypothetical protein